MLDDSTTVTVGLVEGVLTEELRWTVAPRSHVRRRPAAAQTATAFNAIGSGTLDLRRFDRSFAVTNRLRTEATDALLSAAHEAATIRFVAQSFAGWPYGHAGGEVRTEDDPLDDDPLPQMRRSPRSSASPAGTSSGSVLQVVIPRGHSGVPTKSMGVDVPGCS